MNRRTLDIAVISEVHLGTYECHARELTKYLQSIQPKILVLNGNFIDAIQLRKEYFPKPHLQVISEVISMATRGTKVYYLVGNGEDAMHQLGEFKIGEINLRDKLVLQLKGKKYWIFHSNNLNPKGTAQAPWINRQLWYQKSKYWLKSWQRKRDYLGSVKDNNRSTHKDEHQTKVFEAKVASMAVTQGYNGVICGNGKQSFIRQISAQGQSVIYMNSGDWVKSLTALEYNYGEWSLYEYDELDYNYINPRLHVKERKEKSKVSSRRLRSNTLFQTMLEKTVYGKSDPGPIQLSGF